MSWSVVAGLLLVIVTEIALIVAFRRIKNRQENQERAQFDQINGKDSDTPIKNGLRN